MSELFKNINKFGNSTALIDEKLGEVSYSDLVEKSDEIKKKLNSNSIALLIADNSSEFVIGYIAFLRKKKIISILVDNSFSNEFISKIFFIYKPNYLFCPKKFKINFKSLVNVISFSEYEIYRTNYNYYENLNFKNFLLISTSGTTQNPKFVRLSETNIQDNIKKIISYLKINKKQKTITTMPMGYSYGLSIVNSHLVAGSTVVLNNKTVIDKSFWNVIKKYKVNSFGGVPEFYEYLKRINFEKYITKSIKYLTQAGGKLEEKTLGYFGKICKKNKVKFYVMYGQAEASPRMTYLKWEKFFSKINSIGKPLKGYKIKLVDKNRKVINKINTKGEIMFSGRNVSFGYAKNFNDLTKDDENKKTLFTGDLAIKDRENYLYIVGRKNRIIKLFGKRFDLDDIENFFKSKGIKAKCKFNNSKIILNLPSNSNKKSEINSLSNFLGINRNFIIVNENLNRSFKDY